MENSVTSDNPVAYECVGNIARITLRRSPVNALSLEMIRAVVAAFRRAADDEIGFGPEELADLCARNFRAAFDEIAGDFVEAGFRAADDRADVGEHAGQAAHP